MKYIRPATPPALFKRWTDIAQRFGWGKRGARLRLLSVLLDYAEEHPALFRRR